MNERIQQLALQATIRKFDGTGTDMGKLFLDEQKFAELIVRECADYANWYQANSRYTDIAKAIKEHFGVKE